MTVRLYQITNKLISNILEIVHQYKLYQLFKIKNLNNDNKYWYDNEIDDDVGSYQEAFDEKMSIFHR